jgi:hypothetical protein
MFAPQVANPGSRGQDARYKFDPTFMIDLGGGIVTDGTWHYNMAENGPNSMLSLDRPSVNAGNLPPADDTDSVARYAASLPLGQGVGMGPRPAPTPAAPSAPPKPIIPAGEVEITPGHYGTTLKAAAITAGYQKKAYDELMRMAARGIQSSPIGAAVGGHPPPLKGPLPAAPRPLVGPPIQGHPPPMRNVLPVKAPPVKKPPQPKLIIPQAKRPR